MSTPPPEFMEDEIARKILGGMLALGGLAIFVALAAWATSDWNDDDDDLGPPAFGY